MTPVSFASIGECMIELSAGKGDLWRMGFAGDTFNTAWYVRQVLPTKERIAYVTALGQDAFSERMRAFIAKAAVETDRIRTVPGRRPGLYAITLKNAERAFTYWRGESAARLLAEDSAWLKSALLGARMLYFSGITLAILAPPARGRLLREIAARRKAGAAIAFDPNFRPVLWPDKDKARSAMHAAYSVADIALPTFPDEQALFGDASIEATLRRIRDAGVREFVIKNGDRPALVSSADVRNEVPPMHPKQVVDTTGAGDSFNGAYLAARLQDRDPLAATKVGHAVAAEVIGVHGALARIDRRKIMNED